MSLIKEIHLIIIIHNQARQRGFSLHPNHVSKQNGLTMTIYTTTPIPIIRILDKSPVGDDGDKNLYVFFSIASNKYGLMIHMMFVKCLKY